MDASERYMEQIERELAAAAAAAAAGNDGKSRVCARRAAGIALAWYASRFPRPSWRADALSMLRAAQEEGEFSEEVRQAASRLTAKVSDRFAYPFTERPIDDARRIIRAVVERVT